MSVSLAIERPNQDVELVFICTQSTAQGWFADVARRRGFKILTGAYPTIVFDKSDLEQVIFELGVLQGEVLRSLESDERLSEHDRACNREKWEWILERVTGLRSEEGWQADFG